MATYVMLMKFVNPGIDSIKDSPAGRRAGKKAAKAMGITWKQQYIVMGEYDVVTILEAPDDETIARFALLGMGTGSLEISTMRAFNEAESDKLVEGLQGPPE